ncbi:uncharacterized protein LOC133525483 [Cydia pomonella]|uniref:uncharacterized protein LOC133525483 n=1 Tax=Cydia pomonella TaxID=82600 RepID=UPI002ADE7077|nr:uncharacterized protein LOC133525483 [Cydia pomonella]
MGSGSTKVQSATNTQGAGHGGELNANLQVKDSSTTQTAKNDELRQKYDQVIALATLIVVCLILFLLMCKMVLRCCVSYMEMVQTQAAAGPGGGGYRRSFAQWRQSVVGRRYEPPPRG